jgi:hypothetical protein
MIYELRTYTVKPGTLGDMIKAASTVSRDIRKDDYGKLEGYWSTEIGPLNQVLHMWSYNSFDERARMRAELAKNPRWTGEYVPLIRPLLVRQDVRLMNAVRPPVAPASTGNVYELRNYRGKPAGGLKQWLDAFTAVLPARELWDKILVGRDVRRIVLLLRPHRIDAEHVGHAPVAERGRSGCHAGNRAAVNAERNFTAGEKT